PTGGGSLPPRDRVRDEDSMLKASRTSRSVRPMPVGARHACAWQSAALVSMLAAAPALAGRLPDWAKPVAGGAAPVEPGVHEEPLRVLYSETRVQVDEDGSRRTRWRQARQVLTVDGERYGIGAFPFGPNAKVKVSKAWHLPPGEKAERSYGPPVDFAFTGNF